MAKAEWGFKRTCTSCRARFYDLGREPIICPKCGAQLDVSAPLKPKRIKPGAAAKTAAKVAVADSALIDDEDVDEDVDEDINSDLDEDLEEGDVVIEEDDDEDATPAAAAAGSDDDDDDDDETIEDFDNDTLLEDDEEDLDNEDIEDEIGDFDKDELKGS